MASTAMAQERLITIAPEVLPFKATSSAQAPQRVLAATEGLLGYCDGDSITTRGAYFGAAGTYQVGAWLTASSLKSYAGCKVVGIRFAVSQSIDKTTGYLYSINNNMAELQVEKTLRRTSEGWNEIRFNSAQEYTITGEEGLVYAFDYNETDAMVTAEEGALCAYTPSTSSSYASLLYQNGGFASLSGVGNICIQLIVDMSSLPAKKLESQMLLAGNKYKKPGKEIDAFLQYANTGREDIASCQWGYCIDNGEVTTIDQTETLSKGKTGTLEQQIKLPTDMALGGHSLKFFVTKIDGTEPEVGDTITDSFVIYQSSLQRQQHYVEQYTSQQSYYASLVDEQMSALDDNNICLVNVHQPGTALALDEASYLCDLYAYTYPCFTVDRFYFFGESYIAFDVNDYATMMPELAGQSVKMIVNEADANPAFATVTLEPSYDAATHTLSLTVSGDVVDEASAIFGDMAVTVLLTEDNITSPQVVPNSAGTSTTINRKYVHNQVLREYLSAPMGDRLTIEDGHYTATFSKILNSAYKPENMKAVAFIAKAADAVTDDNVLDMDITNANSVKLNTVVSGIQGVNTSATIAAKEFFTLDGRKVSRSALGKGIYIVRQGNKTSKITIR